MDFLSIGPLEVIVIIVVALIVLGPQQMLDVAQKTGRSISRMQGAFKNLLSDSDIDLEFDKTPARQVGKQDSSNSDHDHD